MYCHQCGTALPVDRHHVDPTGVYCCGCYHDCDHGRGSYPAVVFDWD